MRRIGVLTGNDKEIIEKLGNGGWVIENFGSKEAKEFIVKEQQKFSEVAKAINFVPK